MKKIIAIFLCFAFVSAAFAVSATVATWNMQTFFDSEPCGTEYKEFRTDRWNRDAYERRVEAAAEALKKIGADIIVLEEVENEGVLFDLFNAFSAGFNAKKVWKYAAFASEENAAIGIALISRFPISAVHLHAIDVRTFGEKSHARPILEADVILRGKKLTIFANHWKSKLGGGDKIRAVQEISLSRAISPKIQAGGTVIAAGDFNADISEFGRQNGKILLGGMTEVYSAWDFFSSDIGSYAFRGKWERIDQIFFAGAMNLSAFSVLSEPPFTSADGFPARFSVFSGKGLSDHLPLVAHIDFL